MTGTSMVRWREDLTCLKSGLGATDHCLRQAVIATGRPSSPLGAEWGNATAYRGELCQLGYQGNQSLGHVLLTVPQANDHLEGRCFLLAN